MSWHNWIRVVVVALMLVDIVLVPRAIDYRNRYAWGNAYMVAFAVVVMLVAGIGQITAQWGKSFRIYGTPTYALVSVVLLIYCISAFRDRRDHERAQQDVGLIKKAGRR